jgi:O-antigen/teichoic acid export membrane protein
MALSKVISFAYFYAIARIMGPHATGVYFFAVSVTSMFAFLSDLGVTQVVIRSVASGQGNGGRQLGAALRFKLFVTPLAILVSLAYGHFKDASPETMQAIGMACLVMAADSLHLLFYGALRGKQDLRPEALGMLIGQSLTAAFSLTAALSGLGPVWLVGGLLLGSLWNLFWSLRNIRTHAADWLAPKLNDLRLLLVEAWPFMLAGFAVKVYSFIDPMVVEAYHGITAVGVYSVAYKMTYAFQFLPMTIVAALYPALSAAWAKKDLIQIERVFLGTYRLLAAVGFALSAGLSALSPKLIPFIYGDNYLGAIVPFQILPWVILAIFMDFPIGSLLNATHRAKLKTYAMLATTGVSVAANFLLVPRYGTVGAAWAGVISFWFLFGLGLYFVRQDAGGLRKKLSILVRAVAAAGVSWLVWGYLMEWLPFLVAWVLGAIFAVAAAFGLGLLSKNDLRFIANLRKFKPAQTHETT